MLFTQVTWPLSWTSRLLVEGFQMWMVLSQEPDAWTADSSQPMCLEPARSLGHSMA